MPHKSGKSYFFKKANQIRVQTQKYKQQINLIYKTNVADSHNIGTVVKAKHIHSALDP